MDWFTQEPLLMVVEGCTHPLPPGTFAAAKSTRIWDTLKWGSGVVLKSVGYQTEGWCFVIDTAARKTKTASDTRDSRVQENQLFLLNLLDLDNLCLWSGTSSRGGKHLKELQGPKAWLVTQKPYSLTSQACISVPFKKQMCNAFSMCLHTMSTFRDFIQRLATLPAADMPTHITLAQRYIFWMVYQECLILP